MTDDWDISYDIDDLIEPENKKKNPFAKTRNEISNRTPGAISSFGQAIDEWGYDIMEDPSDSLFNKEAHIEFLSPEDYINRVKNSQKTLGEFKINGQSRDENLIYHKEAVNKYSNDMKKGDKFPMPYLRYMDNELIGQEGLHRVNAAKKIGIKKVPTVIMNINTDLPPKRLYKEKQKNQFTFNDEDDFYV